MKRFLPTYLVLLFSLTTFSGCKKDIAALPAEDISFEDLNLDLVITVLPEGDISFTYVEENRAEGRIDYSRGTSCPVQGVGVYQNGQLVDGLAPGFVCTSDVPRGFLLGGTTYEDELNWLASPDHTVLPAGEYSADLHVSLGLIYYPNTPNETTEWENFHLVREFIIN